jgi:hypothetical protein
MKAILVLALPVALIAACTATVTSTPAPQTDAGSDAMMPVMKKDTGVAATCDRVPAKSEYDALYKPAKAQMAGSCSPADMAAIDATMTYGELITAVQKSPTCAACVISKDTDATWGTLILDAAGDLVHVNFGTCSEIATGSVECGKVDAKLYSCEDLACADCTDPADYTACADAAYVQGGTCAQAYANGDFGTCPDAASAKITATCGDGDVAKAIQFLCGSGSTATDAGRD